MSLLNFARLTTHSPEKGGIFLLTTREMKEQHGGSNSFVVTDKNSQFELTFAFDYLESDFVDRGEEFENIHKNNGANYSYDLESRWVGHVGSYTTGVVQLWNLMKLADPALKDFEINSVIFGKLSCDLSTHTSFVRWIESLMTSVEPLHMINDPLAAYQLFASKYR